MVPLARRLLLRNRGGLAVSIAGVAATVSLLFFLFAVHDGVKDGSTRYVRTADVDLWVAQKGSDNVLKSSSFLPASTAFAIAEMEGVTSASPLLRVISKAQVGGRLTSTLFLFGFDPATRLGAPATIGEGSAALEPGGIVLDESFARKYGLSTGDTIVIQQRAFRVQGLSQGTNALVSQFGFVRFEDGATIFGLRDTASFIVVKASAPRDTAGKIREAYPQFDVHESADFIRYHEDEMNSGVLPVFAASAIFGASVGGFIVALMLYSSALERRDDYATLKALGAGHGYLVRLVIGQSLLITLAGCLAAVVATAILTPLLQHFVPSIALRHSPQHLLLLPAALVIGALAAIAPLRVLRRVYPGEVFRA
jgi:putative ABC transport system permease protein